MSGTLFLSPCFASRLALLVLVFGCCVPARAVGEQLAFKLKNTEGELVHVRPMGEEGENRVLTAVVFLGTQCPMARAYVGTLNALQREFQEELHLVAVMSNRQDSPEDVRNYVATTQAKFDVVMDPGNVVADRYGATRTPEVFLLDEGLKLRYHGRIDDQYAPSVARAEPDRQDLREAIRELLAGRPVSIPETKALGCIIGKQKKSHTSDLGGGESGQLTFAEDIYRLLQQHCMECHRTGEIGPFSMEEYEEVVGWADTMMESIDDGRMPPWHANPEHGEFVNSRHMPAQDRELLRSWIDQGLAAGDLKSLPLPVEYVSGWQLEREPDLVLPMRERPFTVPRDGVVEYQYFVVDPGFEEDRWVTAAQVNPGSRQVVHHAIVFVRPPDGRRMQGVGMLTAYVPGQRTLVPPERTARRIPAGSKFVFQMHYTPVGVEKQDLSHVGLFFADDEEVERELVTLAALEQGFEIPPGKANHRVRADLKWLPEVGELLAVTPHMHYRGKSFRLFGQGVHSEAADQDEKILLDVPRYDFNWQHTYVFERPLPMKQLKGLEFEAVFDNSGQNPFNPNPNEWVTWGDQTWEEMALAFFEVSIPRGASMYSRERPDKQANSHAEQKINAYVERVFASLDENSDGVIQKSEGAIVVRHINFSQWDLDGDGRVTRNEVLEVAEKLYR